MELLKLMKYEIIEVGEEALKANKGFGDLENAIEVSYDKKDTKEIAGFKCYKRELLKSIDLDNIRMKGYGFQVEMKYNTYKLGFKIKEVPIIFVDRTEGTSKMSSGIFGEAFWGIIKMKFRRIRPANSIKD